MLLDSLRKMRCINSAIIVVVIVNVVIRHSFFRVESFSLVQTMDKGSRVVSYPGCQPNEQDVLNICAVLSSAIFKISLRFLPPGMSQKNLSVMVFLTYSLRACDHRVLLALSFNKLNFQVFISQQFSGNLMEVFLRI